MRLPVYITEGEPYRPEAIVWLELPSELVLSFTVIDPDGSAPSFADTLRETMRAPMAGPPRLPPRVRVADDALAAEARAALGVLGTEIVVAATPEVDALVASLAEHLQGRGDDPELTAAFQSFGLLEPDPDDAVLAPAQPVRTARRIQAAVDRIRGGAVDRARR